MSNKEFRVIGPPGCGKTTYLSRQVKRAVEVGRRPLLTSLTKAAAYEIGSRVEFNEVMHEDQVGTLHSHCFRSLEQPKLIDKKEHIDSWNQFVGSNAQFHLSMKPFKKDTVEVGREDNKINGDKLYESTLIYRAMMKPIDLWPMAARAFHEKFRQWKSNESLHDFTDLIERTIHECDTAPNDPDVIFVDEAQDHDRLELTLVRRWAEKAQQIIISGDPDQNLYSFRGAEPEAFYETELPEKNKILLKQSYRVPKAVHATAVGMIRRIEDREDVQYLPTAQQGEVRWHPGESMRNAHKIVAKAAKIADGGEDVMILASCGFLLNGIVKNLRDAGMPFHNPYAPDRGQYNPLGTRTGTSSPQRLTAFLRTQEFAFGEEARMWNWAEFSEWIDPISVTGFLRRGSKQKIKEIAARQPELIMSTEDLVSFLDLKTGSEELELIDSDPIPWFRDRLNKSKATAFDYPIQVARSYGIKAMHEKPKIIVGTIHSVKGGEADHVFLFPDLSQQGYAEYQKNSPSVIRAFYVGMTRAKKVLHLFDCAGSQSIKWKD